MTRYAMTINLDRCVGCGACSVACTLHHGCPKDVRFCWVSEKEQGSYPNVSVDYLPHACMQCKNAPCLAVCPTGATYTADDGVILVDADVCIGCKSCMAACPYGARTLLTEVASNHTDGPTAYEDAVFGLHTAGTVEKCDFCYGRRAEGELPICVATCPANARRFGDLDDPSSEVAQLVASGKAHTLLENEKTEPSVFYVYEGNLDIDGIFKG